MIIQEDSAQINIYATTTNQTVTVPLGRRNNTIVILWVIAANFNDGLLDPYNPSIPDFRYGSSSGLSFASTSYKIGAHGEYDVGIRSGISYLHNVTPSSSGVSIYSRPIVNGTGQGTIFSMSGCDNLETGNLTLTSNQVSVSKQFSKRAGMLFYYATGRYDSSSNPSLQPLVGCIGSETNSVSQAGYPFYQLYGATGKYIKKGQQYTNPEPEAGIDLTGGTSLFFFGSYLSMEPFGNAQRPPFPDIL